MQTRFTEPPISRAAAVVALLPEDDVKSGTDIDMRSIVNILCDRISGVEKAVGEQSILIADLTRRGLRVDTGVQADIENRGPGPFAGTPLMPKLLNQLYCRIQNVTKSASGQSVRAQNTPVEHSDSSDTGKLMSRKRKWNGNRKRDVRVHMSSLKTTTRMTSKEKGPGNRIKWKKENQICHLGLSYMILY